MSHSLDEPIGSAAVVEQEIRYVQRNLGTPLLCTLESLRC